MSEQNTYPLACFLCRATNNILIFPHRVDGNVVGLVYSCRTDAKYFEDNELHIYLSGKSPNEMNVEAMQAYDRERKNFALINQTTSPNR